jgi:competence protein ComFC
LKVLLKTKVAILDTLFPMHCVSCNQEGSFLCESCFSKIELLLVQVCSRCEKLITEKGSLCDHCKKDSPALANLVVASRYKDGNISKLVHLYKYNFVEDLHVPLGRLLVKIILKNNLPLPDLIIPIPLHPRRLRWRGFNQSELLVKYVSENLTPGFAIPVVSDIVIRKKYTPPQMQIGKYSERRKNMQDAFALNKKFMLNQPDFLKNKRILLVDDIATTGATLFECAKVLQQNGARKVFGAVIARQEFEK